VLLLLPLLLLLHLVLHLAQPHLLLALVMPW
jgi:hypothetical protein